MEEGNTMSWLRMIRNHVAVSIHMERDDLEMALFDGQGRLGKMVALFGGRHGTSEPTRKGAGASSAMSRLSPATRRAWIFFG